MFLRRGFTSPYIMLFLGRNRMLEKEKVIALIQPLLLANDIADFQVSIKKGKTPTLEICIAKQNGSMDLDTCENISNLISAKLDEVDDSQDAYLLDVCSFGAERPLSDQTDIQKAVGQYIHVDLKEATNGLSSLEATLDSFENNQLKLTYFMKGIKKTTVIDYSNVTFARIAVK